MTWIPCAMCHQAQCRCHFRAPGLWQWSEPIDVTRLTAERDAAVKHAEILKRANDESNAKVEQLMADVWAASEAAEQRRDAYERAERAEAEAKRLNRELADQCRETDKADAALDVMRAERDMAHARAHRAEAEVADYRRTICLETTCVNCARLLEQLHTLEDGPGGLRETRAALEGQREKAERSEADRLRWKGRFERLEARHAKLRADTSGLAERLRADFEGQREKADQHELLGAEGWRLYRAAKSETRQLRDHLAIVLRAWHREAHQGDGFDERHVAVYEEAKAALEGKVAGDAG